MTGTVVRSQSAAAGVTAVVFFLITLAFVVGAFLTATVHLAIFAIVPFILAITSVLIHDPAVQFEITHDGLSFETPDNVFVRYRDIQGLTARGGGRTEKFAMQLYHLTGVIRIPANLDVPSWKLYEYLLDRLPAAEPAHPDLVPASLHGFVSNQLELFGAEKVFVFRARPYPPLSTYGRHVAYSWGTAIGGLCWAAAGVILSIMLHNKNAADEMGEWVAAGVVLIFMGMLFAFLFSRSNRSGRVANWRDSFLVISPGGVALLQGSLKGRLRWDELRAIEYPAKPRFGLATAGGAVQGIGLLVEGAYLIIADYYDRPLELIHSHLMDYWGGRDAN